MTNIEEIYAAMSADELASFKAASAQHHDQSTPEFLAANKALVLLQDRLGHDHPEVTAEANRVWAMGPQGMRDFWDNFNAKRAKQAAERERYQSESTPAYRAAAAEVKRLADLYGQHHQITVDAMTSALMLAPDCMKEWMSEEIEALGLLPKASGYTDDGEPVYSLADLAERLEMPYAEAVEAAGRIHAPQVNQSQIHTIQ